MNTNTLRLTPEPLDEDEEASEFIRSANAQTQSREAFYATLARSTDRVQAFVAPSPEVALRWVCERVDKRRFIQYVNSVYIRIGCDVDDSEATNSVCESGDDARHSKKRTRGTTQKSVRRKRSGQLQQQNNDLLRLIANSQDGAMVNHHETPLNEEQQRYRDFALRLPGAGIAMVTSMISKAAAVATKDCLKDWQSILKVWRAQHREGKRMFNDVTAQFPLTTDIDGALLVSPHRDRTQSLVLSQRQTAQGHVLTPSDTVDFKSLFLAAQESQAVGIVGDMRHRWIMAAMYLEYEALEGVIRRRSAPSGGRGRGFATVAKEQLFGSVYRTQGGTMATREACQSEWKEFGHWLDYGKRWAMLQQKFGVGIFALLPRSVVSNTFVERTLTMPLFTEWVEMVATCNEHVKDMASGIRLLYTSCMREESPPPYLFLEDLTGDELDDCDPMLAISPLQGSQRPVEEVDDDTVIPNSWL